MRLVWAPKRRDKARYVKALYLLNQSGQKLRKTADMLSLLTFIPYVIDCLKWRFARSPFSFVLSLVSASWRNAKWGPIGVNYSPVSGSVLCAWRTAGDTRPWAMVAFPRTANVSHTCYVPRSLSLGPCRTFPYESIAQDRVCPEFPVTNEKEGLVYPEMCRGVVSKSYVLSRSVANLLLPATFFQVAPHFSAVKYVEKFFLSNPLPLLTIKSGKGSNEASRKSEKSNLTLASEVSSESSA